MSKELLADPIVITAQNMEHNEVEVISVIRYYDDRYSINCPVRENFNSFENAYNYLAMKGYQQVSQDKDTHFKKSMEVSKEPYSVVMVMSRKLKSPHEESSSNDNNNSKLSYPW